MPRKKLPELVAIGRDGSDCHKIVTKETAPSCSRWPRGGASTPWSFYPRPEVRAGLLPDAWLDEDTQVQHFLAQIFAEVATGREVFEKSFLGGRRGRAGRDVNKYCLSLDL